MYNPIIWKHRFESDFIPAIYRVRDVFLLRLLPTFSSIDSDTDEYTKQLEKDALARPYYDDGPDESDIYDGIRDASISYYQGLKGMEQGITNCCALFLYHLYEQQSMIFLRQELLDWKQRGKTSQFTQKKFKAQLLKAKVDVSNLPSWSKLEELRHLANTIKHAEGDASNSLYSRAPHLFEPRTTHVLPGKNIPPSSRVYAPLLGEDIFVTAEQINEYTEACAHFWIELADALEAQ